MDLENYRSKMEKQGLSDSYIDDILTAGKTVVNKAFENGMIGIDSLRNFKAVKKTLSAGDNRRDKILTVEEFHRLLDSAADHVKGILLAGYWTGLRQNDVLSLTWGRIDLQNRIICFEVKHRRRQKPKPREVYICDELHRFLLKHDNRLREAGEDNHVFHYSGNPIQSIKRAVKTACEKAKIPYGQNVKDGFVFHDLRHTSVTDMRRSGVDPLVNKVWHGHSISGDAHEGYHTFNREDLRRSGQLLQEYRNRQRTIKDDDQIANVDQTVDQTAKNER